MGILSMLSVEMRYDCNSVPSEQTQQQSVAPQAVRPIA